jgi:hypothetical protein
MLKILIINLEEEANSKKDNRISFYGTCNRPNGPKIKKYKNNDYLKFKY